MSIYLSFVCEITFLDPICLIEYDDSRANIIKSIKHDKTKQFESPDLSVDHVFRINSEILMIST